MQVQLQTYTKMCLDLNPRFSEAHNIQYVMPLPKKLNWIIRNNISGEVFEMMEGEKGIKKWFWGED